MKPLRTNRREVLVRRHLRRLALRRHSDLQQRLPAGRPPGGACRSTQGTHRQSGRRTNPADVQELELGLADALNRRHLDARDHDSELAARIRTF